MYKNPPPQGGFLLENKFYSRLIYGIIIRMMKKIFILLCVGSLCGCRGGANVAPVYYDEYDFMEYDDASPRAQCATGNCSDVAVSAPSGNDLRLETNHHVIQIDGVPGTRYTYYVWTGGKPTSDDPDVIVDDGVAAILVEE